MTQDTHEVKLVRRSPEARRAYIEGWTAAMEIAAKIADDRAKVWEGAEKANMHSPCAMSLWEECEDIAEQIRKRAVAGGLVVGETGRQSDAD